VLEESVGAVNIDLHSMTLGGLVKGEQKVVRADVGRAVLQGEQATFLLCSLTGSRGSSFW
jgi:hypothetical protein